MCIGAFTLYTLPEQGITWSSSRPYSTRVRYLKLGISYSISILNAPVLNPTNFKPHYYANITHRQINDFSGIHAEPMVLQL